MVPLHWLDWRQSAERRSQNNQPATVPPRFDNDVYQNVLYCLALKNNLSETVDIITSGLGGWYALRFFGHPRLRRCL